MEKERWIYKSTAKKQYGITDNQIRLAVDSGLIAAKSVRNPHYSSGPPSLLLKAEDVEKNLLQIKSLPKFDEAERERRKVYSERKRMRDKLEFYCPRCRRTIRALKGSLMFEEFFRGGVSVEDAQKALKIAHYRHAHTNYEADLAEIYAWRRERYLELRSEGLDFDTAWMLVDDEFKEDSEKIKELKKTYNREAVKLLKEDGLLS